MFASNLSCKDALFMILFSIEYPLTLSWPHWLPPVRLFRHTAQIPQRNHPAPESQIAPLLNQNRGAFYLEGDGPVVQVVGLRPRHRWLWSYVYSMDQCL